MPFRGERLRAVRILRGYQRQSDFADALTTSQETVTQQMISKYETGKSPPSVEMLIRIIELLNCSADFLLGRHDHTEPLTEDESRWLREHRSGNDSTLEAKLREAARNKARPTQKKT